MDKGLRTTHLCVRMIIACEGERTVLRIKPDVEESILNAHFQGNPSETGKKNYLCPWMK